MHWLMIGGTSESVEAVKYLISKKVDITVSAATDMGAALYKDFPVKLWIGYLNKEQFIQKMKAKNITHVLDASHPYAVEVTRTVKAACQELGLNYFRYTRRDAIDAGKMALDIYTAADGHEAAEILNKLPGNAALLTKIRSCARRAGYLTHSEDAFGRQMSGYNGIPFMDMQYYYDTAEKKEKPVVPITSREYGASSSKTTVTGLTDLYAVRLGLDGFHAVSPMGGKVISTTLPDFSTAGPVKAGDVEMVAATVLKKSRAAGVLRNFKVK